MEIQKLQKRELFIPNCLSIREGDGEKQEAIEGVAIVCNKETVLYECADYREVEVIDPSCINEAFIKEQDITLNALHERQLTFGRTGGNLTVESREDGLAFRCVGTSDKFRETRALINDGVYTGCSFEFYPKDYAITEREGQDGKLEYVIRHSAFDSITALTVAMNPAYKQTSVNARELYREQNPDENTDEEQKEDEKPTEAPVPEDSPSGNDEPKNDEAPVTEASPSEEDTDNHAREARQRERDLYLMTL